MGEDALRSATPQLPQQGKSVGTYPCIFKCMLIR